MTTERGGKSAQDALERRARTLAGPRKKAHTEERGQVMRFDAGGEPFALDVAEVAAVGRPGALTTLPGAARPLYAVASWRGQVISVVDVAAARDAAAPPAGVFVIVLVGGRIGVLADASPEIVPRLDTPSAPRAGTARHVAAILLDGTTLLDAAALRGQEPHGKEGE